MPQPKKGRRLGGGASHQKAILANLAKSLIEHEKLETTQARAKEVQPLVDKLVGLAKRGDFPTAEFEGLFPGRKGGMLWTLSTANGGMMGELELPAPPVWDGLAAAGGYCYLPLKDGAILCLGASGG